MDERYPFKKDTKEKEAPRRGRRRRRGKGGGVRVGNRVGYVGKFLVGWVDGPQKFELF